MGTDPVTAELRRTARRLRKLAHTYYGMAGFEAGLRAGLLEAADEIDARIEKLTKASKR